MLTFFVFVSNIQLYHSTLKATILSWQPGHVYVMPFLLARNWWEGEEPATDFGILQSAAKSFFKAIIHFTTFCAIISEFGACLAQNNMVQEQP